MMHKSLCIRLISVSLLAFATLGLAQSPVFTYYGNVVPTPQNTSPQFISGATPQATAAVAATATTPSSDAQAIVVSRAATAANVTLTLDKSGQVSTPTYSTGESIGVSVATDKDGYLYIFESTSANVSRLVFPPVGDTTVPNRVRGGFTYSLPPQGYDYLFTVGDAFGWNKVTAVVSATPMTEAEMARIANPTMLGQASIAGAGGTTAGSYGTGSADFYLNAVATTTTAGSELPGGTQTRTIAPLVVNPGGRAGAAIYVQNANAATSAARTFTASNGNSTFNINVYTLASGAQVGLVDLGQTGVVATDATANNRAAAQTPAQAPGTGTLLVRSNDIGASVYIDGNFIGQISSSGELAINGLAFGDHELMAGASGSQTQQIRFRLDSATQYYDLALTPIVAATTQAPTTQTQAAVRTGNTQNTTAGYAYNAGSTYGHINVNTTLSGVQVFVNGAPMATTPLRAPISLPPNTYSVTLKRDGMQDLTQNVTVNSNQTEFLQLP